MLSYTSSMVVFTALSVKQYACMQFCNNYSLNRLICKKTLQREMKFLRSHELVNDQNNTENWPPIKVFKAHGVPTPRKKP